jgi:hypothetical protein
MLKPEQAKEMLNKWRLVKLEAGEEEDDDDNSRPRPCLARVKKLPGTLRTAALAILGLNEKEEQLDWDVRTKQQSQAAAALDKASAKDRAKVFEALLPGLTKELEATWQLQQELPYQSGYARKPFRAPQLSQHAAHRRAQWLSEAVSRLENFDPKAITPAWLAAWAPHLTDGSYSGDDSLGYLLAAAINAGGKQSDEVLQILKDSGSNQHDIGHMGRHVTRALLTSSRPEAWEYVEKLLLAAQRQEGLRQTILETVDEANPQAFRRIVKLILDQNLARFSSVVRAFDVWFGLMWDSVSTKVVVDALKQVHEYLADPAARKKALAGKDAEAVYLALWTAALEDAPAAVKLAQPLLKDGKVEKRFAAAKLLAWIALPESAAALLPALEDEDLRVALTALEGMRVSYDEDEEEEAEGPKDLFERLERLLARMPEKSTQLKPLVWPWTAIKTDRSAIAYRMVEVLGDRPAAKLLPLMPILSTWHKSTALEKIVAQKKYDNATREVLLRFAADAATDVREMAIGAIVKTKLKPDEAPQMEKALTRKTADVRRSVIGLLLTQDDAAALASAERLLAAGDINQRLAGLEVLRLLAEAGRQAKRCQQQGEAYRVARKKLAKEEETQLSALARAGEKKITLDDGLGLVDVSKLAKRIAPKPRKVDFITPAALACLKSLDDFIHEHRQTPVRSENDKDRNGDTELLGDKKWWFCSVDRTKATAQEAAKGLPLRELWEQWFAGRPNTLRDKDGLEILRAYVYYKHRMQQDDEWKAALKSMPATKKVAEIAAGKQPPPKLRYTGIIDDVLEWLFYLHPVDGAIDYLLDAVEGTLAQVPADVLAAPRPPLKPNQKKVPSYMRDEEPEIWREMQPYVMWKDAAEEHFKTYSKSMTPQQRLRWWRLQHWADTPIPGEYCNRPDIDDVLAAWKAGEASEHDVLEHLVGPRTGPGELDERADENSWRYGGFRSLGEYSSASLGRSQREWLKALPQLSQLVDRCRERILEIELARGETPTAATKPALELAALHGVPTLVRVLTEMGKEKFKKERYSWRQSESRQQVLSRFVTITFPTAGDTPESFCQAIEPLRKAGLIDDQRLAQLAFLAPQWLNHIEAALQWPGFAEGVYWYLAHMSYADTSGLDSAESADEDEDTTAEGASDEDEPKEKRSPFEKIVAERTPLTREQRMSGAIDVGWFRRTYEQLGKKRWEALAEAGKFAASSQQAAKAQLIGDVILGKASKTKLVAEIRKKKLKNPVRLLGLFPLPDAAEPRRKELIDRYKVLQEYHRYARGLSAMSKPGAMQAVEIGLANLASTAGFADPLRMTWALEADSLADLRKGPITATADGVTATLSLTEDAKPQLAYAKGDKPLKSAPPNVRKNKKVAELIERNSELKRAASRVKASLETMMCRGDTFSGDELKQLAVHPLIWPLLSRLVIVGEGIMGYPDKGGAVLRNQHGKLEPIKKGETLRIAHCHDLWSSDKWPEWQRECFTAERVQPLKQVFRELYLVTKQEKTDGTISRRYAGQQINPRQAFALFGQRGWRTEDGVEKTFYDLALNVDVSFLGGWGSPTDVEGLTLEGVQFRKRDEYKPLKLTDIPPRVFSEVMRDLDLVVSVAHRGGVDPEASASTVEMRAALIEETCALLGITNAKIKNSHVLIKGEMSEYSIHLGSGVVHRQPGGSLCIVAVGAQHRGRLFLPFADDDPRTAEVISKVLLLARDNEIQDPTILEQIRSGV